MNDIRIIFFDIDGTLIDMQKKHVTEKTLEALRRLQANGIRICLATGRSPVALPRFDGVEFDAYCTFNGSYCYAGEEEILSNPIPQQDVLQVIENAARIGRPVLLATRDRFAANGRDTDLVDYFAVINLGIDVVPDFDEVARRKVYQIMSGGRKEEYDDLLRGVSGAKIAAWWHRAVDIIPAGGGKGRGIEKILEYFGLNRSQAMAFGDGNNDIEMFQAVDHPVAMGNASDTLKALSGDVCGHVAEDGIYHYCMEKGLI